MNILFLCTHNSARSVLAESTLNALGNANFRGYSAGSQPSGRINPHAIALLASLGHDIAVLRSKSWDEFAGPEAPRMDVVITVCGDAAEEACPMWPGGPVKGHWGLPDPSRAAGDEAAKAAAFKVTQQALAERIARLVALAPGGLDAARLADIHASSAPGYVAGNADAT